MKLFGGHKRAARRGASGGRHLDTSKSKSAFSRLPRYARVLVILVLVLAVLSVTVFCVYLALSKPPERAQTPSRSTEQDSMDVQETDAWKVPTRTQTEKVTDEQGNEIEVETEVPLSYKEGVYNILICGTDGDGTRTDTIMVANLNSNEHTVALMSIPRDTLISANYTVPKINSAFAYGGIDALKEQLAKLLGFKVDGYVVVDLEAFVKIVDLVGGVEFDVPQDMYYNDPTQDLYINLKKGVQLLDGAHAIQLVRYRKYASADIGRISVQQDFLRALAKKCVSIGSLTKIGEYAEIISEYVQTDLSVGNMIWFGQELLKCDFDKMQTYTPEGEGVSINGGSYYMLYSRSILEIVNEAFNPYQTDLTASDITVRSVSKSSGSSSGSGSGSSSSGTTGNTSSPGESDASDENPTSGDEQQAGDETVDSPPPDEVLNPDDGAQTELPPDDGEQTGGSQSGSFVPFDPIPGGSSTPEPDPGENEYWP